MAQQDEVTRRENEMLQRQEQAEDVRRSHSEALQQECREALYEGAMGGQTWDKAHGVIGRSRKVWEAEYEMKFFVCGSVQSPWIA
eukprot:s328_g3.t1